MIVGSNISGNDIMDLALKWENINVIICGEHVDIYAQTRDYEDQIKSG